MVAVASAALTTAAPLPAHVTPRPPAVPMLEETAVALDVPNERDVPLVGFDVTVPAQLSIVAAPGADGWSAILDGATARWDGGVIASRDAAAFELRVRAAGPSGTVELDTVLRYEDGATVRWKVPLVVLPASGAAAPGTNLGRGLVAGAIGLSLIVGTLFVRHWRRGPLHNG